MGLDSDLLVHPERLSSQLICPICTQVLKNPVQTSTEHLFCEEELLEWMTISSLCPVTKVQLVAQEIKKPSRIILNMLAELEVFCPNKVNGCKWTGLNETIDTHFGSCEYKPIEDLKKDIAEKDKKIFDLLCKVDSLEARCSDLEEENKTLKGIITENNRRLRVYNALAESKQGDVSKRYGASDMEVGINADPPDSYSDAIRLMRLKSNSINEPRK
jgi:hypothetical protein